MNWNHIWMLVKFEINHTKFYFLWLACILTFLFFVARFSFPMQMEQSNFSLDFLFIFFIWAFLISRPKVFRNQKRQDNRSLTPFLVMLQQLPISKATIITYRFVHYLIVFAPIHILFFICLYIFSPATQQFMTISEYIVFSLIWLCLGVLLFWTQIFQDMGLVHSVFAWIERIVLMVIIVIIYFILFYGLFTKGFVPWTVYIAVNHPILSVISAIFSAVSGTLFLKIRAQRKMAQFDYYE